MIGRVCWFVGLLVRLFLTLVVSSREVTLSGFHEIWHGCSTSVLSVIIFS